MLPRRTFSLLHRVGRFLMPRRFDPVLCEPPRRMVVDSLPRRFFLRRVGHLGPRWVLKLDSCSVGVWYCRPALGFSHVEVRVFCPALCIIFSVLSR